MSDSPEYNPSTPPMTPYVPFSPSNTNYFPYSPSNNNDSSPSFELPPPPPMANRRKVINLFGDGDDVDHINPISLEDIKKYKIIICKDNSLHSSSSSSSSSISANQVQQLFQMMQEQNNIKRPLQPNSQYSSSSPFSNDCYSFQHCNSKWKNKRSSTNCNSCNSIVYGVKIMNNSENINNNNRSTMSSVNRLPIQLFDVNEIDSTKSSLKRKFNDYL
jgi:hypothetical protein